MRYLTSHSLLLLHGNQVRRTLANAIERIVVLEQQEEAVRRKEYALEQVIQSRVESEVVKRIQHYRSLRSLHSGHRLSSVLGGDEGTPSIDPNETGEQLHVDQVAEAQPADERVNIDLLAFAQNEELLPVKHGTDTTAPKGIYIPTDLPRPVLYPTGIPLLLTIIPKVMQYIGPPSPPPPPTYVQTSGRQGYIHIEETITTAVDTPLVDYFTDAVVPPAPPTTLEMTQLQVHLETDSTDSLSASGLTRRHMATDTDDLGMVEAEKPDTDQHSVDPSLDTLSVTETVKGSRRERRAASLSVEETESVQAAMRTLDSVKEGGVVSSDLVSKLFSQLLRDLDNLVGESAEVEVELLRCEDLSNSLLVLAGSVERNSDVVRRVQEDYWRYVCVCTHHCCTQRSKCTIATIRPFMPKSYASSFTVCPFIC